jgi:hypothetical protein
MDRGPRQQSASLRHHTIVYGRTDQLACLARGQREYPTRHLRELPAYLRIVSLLQQWRAVAHTSSALAVAYAIIQF